MDGPVFVIALGAVIAGFVFVFGEPADEDMAGAKEDAAAMMMDAVWP